MLPRARRKLVPHGRTNLDYLDDEIEREAAIFRGESPNSPAPRRNPRLALAEFILGGAAVGILIVALIVLLEAAASLKRRRRRRRP